MQFIFIQDELINLENVIKIEYTNHFITFWFINSNSQYMFGSLEESLDAFRQIKAQIDKLQGGAK